MSKIFLLVASLMCISTLAACSGRADVDSDPTSRCPFSPFEDACSGERFDTTRIEHCNSAGLAVENPQTPGQPPATLAECTELAEATPCLANPFQEICEETPVFEDININNLRAQRIFLCTFGRGGIALACSFVASCGDNQNPFDAECLKFDEFDGNRTTRIRLCTARQDTNVAGCRLNQVGGQDNQTIHECITATPFHADCTDDTFDEARLRRVVACAAASPDADLNCSSPIGAGIGTDDGTQTIANCITNPFHVDCQNLAFNTVRAERMIACGGASVPSGIGCTEAREGVTAAVWLRSFDGSNNNPPLDTEPDTMSPRNQFLQGHYLLGSTQRVRDPETAEDPNPDPLPVQRALDIGDALRGSGAVPVVQSLNLATAFYGEGDDRDFLITDDEGNPAGDASDGVAFFFGSVIAGTAGTVAADRNAYAGILAGTDLGAVPPTTTESATWNGQIRALGYFPAKDFKLDIDFSAQSLTAFVQVRNNNTRHFSISGTFNNNGVISGTVELGNYTDNVNDPANLLANDNRGTGQLTGLIGEEGAVGVFLKNNDDTGKSFNFAGGFVAAPTPDPAPTP